MKNKNKNITANISFIFIGIILVLYSISILIPFAWVIMTSMKSRTDFVLNGPLALPKVWEWKNYLNAWNIFRVIVSVEKGTRSVYLAELFFNSVVYSFGLAFVTVATQSIGAYLCARFRYKFSNFMFSLVVVLMMIPVVGNMSSMLMVLKALNIYDTFFGMICMKAYIGGTYFIILYGTFKGIPNGYAEAAKIDGASNTCIMFRIMFPLVRTTIAAVYMLTLIALWNDYMTPLMYYPSHPTAALGLMLYNQNNLVNSIPDKLAGSIIVTVPILIVFLCFKKYLMGNLTMGGLKG